jgi:hypothetical protein
MKTVPRSGANKKPIPKKKSWSSVGTGLLWTVYFLYIALIVRPEFLYNALITDGGYVYPPFPTGFDFFSEALRHPGGVAWYLSSFLFQSYANPWLGALTISAAAGCSFALNRMLLRRFFGYPLDLFAYAPAMVALVTLNRYGDPMGLLVNYDLILAFTIITIDRLIRRSSWHAVVFPLCFAIVYYFAGGGSVFYTVLVVLYALQNKRRGVHIAATAAISLAAAALLYFYGDLRAILQYVLLTGGYPVRRLMTGATVVIDVPSIVASGFMAAIALLSPLFRATAESGRSCSAFGFLSGTAGSGIALLVAAVCIVFTNDEGRRMKLTFEYLDRVGAPADVVSRVNRFDPAHFDRLVLFDLNRALSRLGLLGETMFAYPQNPGALTLDQPTSKFWVPALIRNAEHYYELGCLNLSKAALAELFEGSRIEHPAVIELLGKNALAHGRPAIAKMWYRRLSRDLVYGKKAREVIQYLDGGRPFSGLDTLEQVRKNAVRHDTVITLLDIKIFCAALLDENPGNRMAFDYLVGSYLLSGDLPSAARYLPRFREAGYDRLPRNWAEALMVYYGLNPSADAELLTNVQPDVRMSFMKFMGACRAVRERCDRTGMSNEQYVREASTSLRSDFGSTYFFYYFFHSSGESRWYR